MKRILLFIFTLSLLFILSACGSSELDEFVNDFNQSSRKYDTNQLIENEFRDYKDEGENWSMLYESKEYDIEVAYDKGNGKKKVSAYYIIVRSDTDYIDKTGKGYNAALTFADSLRLNIKEFEKSLQEGFNDSFYNYKDGDFDVNVVVSKITDTTMSILVQD